MSINFYAILLLSMENIEPKQSKKETIWELARFAIIAIVIVIPVRIFIAQPFIVSGSSMVPTFQNGDYLIVDEISYRLKNPERFDVIVFRYPHDQTKFFIKRIIGLPNEELVIKNGIVTIINTEHPDGFVLDQPYVKNESKSNEHLKLKENEYFVMGDNRSASSDSRYWGALTKNLIMGKAFIRLFPIKEIDLLPGYFQQTDNY
jgi:signal peptidase I